MKTIIINARFLTQQITGVQRYAIELVKEIDFLLEEGFIDKNKYKFVLLAPKNIKMVIPLKHISLKKVGFLKGHAWEQLELPIYSYGGFLLNLCNAAPILKWNQIVTIHDVAVFASPKTFSFLFRIWYKILILLLGKIATHIITVSFFSKGELIRYCDIKEDKISVIYEGADHILKVKKDNSIISKYNLTKKAYVLAVSSMNPRKNFRTIIEALAYLERDNIEVVIAGSSNSSLFAKYSIEEKEFVTHVGYVTDEELRSLYEHASCFVYPSIYEGFGIPPLEAMACNCPVILSDCASLPEISREGALYCNPFNPQDIAEQVKKVIGDKEFRNRQLKLANKRVQEFTWRKCAIETYQLINRFNRADKIRK